MLVGLYSFQTLKHFITGNGEPALCCVHVREKCAPHRMSVKNCSSTAHLDNCKMKQRLGRGLAGAAEDFAFCVDFKELLRLERSLIKAGSRNQQAGGIALQHGAKVTARAQDPATAIECAPRVGESRGKLAGGFVTRTSGVISRCHRKEDRELTVRISSRDGSRV